MLLKHNIDYSFIFTGNVKIWPGLKIEILDKKNQFLLQLRDKNKNNQNVLAFF